MPLSRGWSKSGSRNRQRIPGSEWSQKWTWASVNGSVDRTIGHRNDGAAGRERDRHRERAVRDADRLGPHEPRVVDLVVGQAPQDGVERDVDLAACQGRPEAAVGPEAERHVPVGEPVEHHLVRPFEHLRVAIGRGPHEQHPVALGDRAAADLDVTLGGARRARTAVRRRAGTPRPPCASGRARRSGAAWRHGRDRGRGGRC